MTPAEQFQFSRFLAAGMRKSAGIGRGPITDIESTVVRNAKDITPRLKLKHMLLAGGAGAAAGYGGAALQHGRVKQAAIPGFPALGRFVGHAATNALDAGGVTAGAMGKGLRSVGQFLRKPRSTGFGQGFDQTYQRGAFGSALRGGAPPEFQTPRPNIAPTNLQTPRPTISPEHFQSPNPSATPPPPMPGSSEFSGPVTPTTPVPGQSTAVATTNRGWTGGPQPEAGGGNPLWRQNLQAFQSKWNKLPTWGKGVAAYGGVTAATAPSNYANNAKAQWQTEHPVMSYLGRTFGGMPEYNNHSYALPSFLQH